MLQHLTHLNQVAERQPTFVALGSFDGVHLGHQAVLKEMVAAAKAVGARTAVLTFFPHPAVYLRNITDRYYLNTLEQRVAYIGELGIDLVISHPFNEDTRTTSAQDFVMQMVNSLNMVELWGGDIHLGHNREGNMAFLSTLGQEMGFAVKTVDDGLVEWNGAKVSSTRVREALAAGDMETVMGCLNRPFSLTGTILVGDKIGRTIGFPTANLGIWEQQLRPANGVYATTVEVRGQTYKAATNVGVRPTVDGKTLRIEAHLLDFDDDIYGEELTISFHKRIRGEQKFAGLDALMAQIGKDVEAVRGMKVEG